MKTAETLKRLEEITNFYLHELDQYSMEQLTRKPSDEEWSLGQMYLHLINTALYMQLRNIEACRSGGSDSPELTGEKTEVGKTVFAQGSIPPVQIKVPSSPQYTPQQPESKEQIVEGLNAVVRKMSELEPALDEISPAQTVLHPGFGALNAKEWFALVEMHYRHHVHQLNRLKTFAESVN